MYHAACKVEFQPFTRSYSQLTFFNFYEQVRAGPGKRPWAGQYRNITPNFWSLNLIFWHVIWNKLSNTLKVGCKKTKDKLSSYGRPKVSAEAWGGEKCIDFFFFFLHPTSTVFLSLIQITCQNFRSKIQKLSEAQQKFSFPHFTSSLYGIFKRL